MAVPKDVRDRVSKLRAAIAAYRAEYHLHDESSISPEALDSLKHDLVLLEEQYPELTREASPTKKVAGGVLPGLQKVKHEVQQWSLDDVFDEEEFRAFDERIQR
ncbi:NAD-dependent DNA ligase LigA, partial [Patescibacteria group bacterium]|nr:NAD-dependent DNA ligase LigA [Patescibacteria group bacterium]MBU1754894.1 NAD-dependent DNA ligase LigA [Patescibacteria group bacterium]